MGARFESEFVYILDQNNAPHFVMTHYFANLGDSYRSDIYLENKRYCVLDLLLTDEVETEGEFLPYPRESEWRNFFSAGPSENISTILQEAALADISVSKLVFARITSSSRCILEYDGFVASAEGVQDFADHFWEQALANTKPGNPADREYALVDQIVTLVQAGI